jgi:hypothetical protein
MKLRAKVTSPLIERKNNPKDYKEYIKALTEACGEEDTLEFEMVGSKEELPGIKQFLGEIKSFNDIIEPNSEVS